MSDRDPLRRGRRPGDVRVVVHGRPKLPRTIGVGALFSACYGNVGSSIYYGLGVTAAFALGLTPLALILAGGIFITTALNYAEGTSAMPHAGGASSFARRAFNEPIGFIVGWIQLLNYTVTCSISAFTAIAYLGDLGHYVPILGYFKDDFTIHIVGAGVLIGLLIAINIVGIQESSLVNLSLAILDLITQLVLVLLGVILLLNIGTVVRNVHWGVAPTWGNFLASISIAMVTYTGIETISNLSEEAKNPGKTVPRATYLVIVAVLFVSAFLPTIGMSVFPVYKDASGHYTTLLATKWVNDPVAGIVSQFHPEWLAHVAGVWLAILAFTILVIATNAGLLGISRLSYSLATNDLFPKQFAQLHPRFKTPYISIIVFGIVAALLVLPGQINQMGAVYSLAATFAFCSAHLSVMRLRYVEPELYRPYEMPLNIKFGRSRIPILSVVGALAIGTVFTQLMFQNISNSSWIYVGWLIMGVIAFVFYRRYRGDPLWEPLESPPPPDREVVRKYVPPPQSARVRIGRKSHKVEEREPAAAPAEPEPVHEHHRTRFLGLHLMIQRHGRLRVALGLALCVGLSVLALVGDLSQFDPFGPGLGWSPGIIMVALVAGWMLLRSHEES
jgi:basic amino acid/polyamine antiporter, APA family